ncbi:secretin and TonB N-terminal domain-containing protein [Herbaspirillum robiniae]|uniref:TonB-dependent outer membrane receptor n=1 Tax=Herbaspirillum robiniae TaxID=2014887 RepID=A0A246WTT8_9BURK|nr:secretin and TonB N-terminal domain-containing protein [Herbaspirillum robiniae]OWY30397.1 TonB-dependent outer membrane receptor [Herbaspirillum robiniae]
MSLALRPPLAGGAFALSLYVLACLLAAGRVAAAENTGDAQLMQFEILPQNLESALALFSETTGYSVLIGGELLVGRRSAGVTGNLAPRQALQNLLQGTGLSARFIGEKAFTLSVGAASEDPSPMAGATGDEARSRTPSAISQDFSFKLQRAITRALCLAQPEAFGRYRLGLQLWLESAGRISDVRLLQSSGVPARDRQVLASLRGLEVGAPPAGQAQPLTILLTPRPAPDADCLYFTGEVR